MSSASTAELTRVITPSRSLRQHAVDLWQYRELLGNLIRKELKVKYKGSALGFLWSLVNPLMYLVIFYIAFQILLGGGLPSYAVFILSGLLAWNFFSVSAAGSVGSIVGNASLVNKVYFPREILPLALVGANLVHFALQAAVLGVTLVGVSLYRVLGDHSTAKLATLPSVDWRYLWLLIPAVIVLVILTAAFSIFLACINVYARDTQHLLELAILAWFWITPIVYSWGQQSTSLVEKTPLPGWITLLNPITSIVLAFQRALYGIVYGPPGADAKTGVLIPGGLILPDEGSLWYFRNLVIVGAVSLVLLGLAVKLFDRLEGNFAEEL